MSYLDVIGWWSKNLFLRIFVRCSLYKVFSEIVLIKPLTMDLFSLTMDLYSLVSCIPMNTSRFTQKCDCFQNHSDNYFYSLNILCSR